MVLAGRHVPLPYRVVLMAAVLLAASCTRQSPLPYGGAAMPSPNECYVLVSDKEGLAGAREYINGPARLFALTELPFGSNWHHRIRSLRAGARATATVWADQGFQGPSLRLAPNAQQRALSETLSGRIESLEIACQAQ